MTITVAVTKGAFKAEVHGSRIHLVCVKKDCRDKPVQELDDRQIQNSNMNADILTPCAWDGRPSGTKNVTCPYCLNSGTIKIKHIRDSPDRVGNFTITKTMNQDPTAHMLARLKMSYVMFRSIDFLARTGSVKPSAHVVAPGTSVQLSARMRGPKRPELCEDAHQNLRELTIDGQRLYEFKVQPLSQACAFAMGVTSHIPKIYNDCDGLIEAHITVPLLILGQECVSGKLRKLSVNEESFYRILWDRLCEAYWEAIILAKKDAEGELLVVLAQYQHVAKSACYTLPPPFVAMNPVALWKHVLIEGGVT